MLVAKYSMTHEHQLDTLGVTGLSPGAPTLTKSFAERKLGVPAGGRQRGLKPLRARKSCAEGVQVHASPPPHPCSLRPQAERPSHRDLARRSGARRIAIAPHTTLSSLIQEFEEALSVE